VNGAFEAFEALNIATINILSGAMAVTGGVLWYFDVRGLEELRTRVREAIGVGGARDEKEAEEEMEEWLAVVLKRKEEKEEKRRKGSEGDR
jgi:hypothetical protein